MKKTIRRTILYRSIHGLIGCLLICVTTNILLARDGTAQDLDEVIINISIKDATIEELFSSIEKRTRFSFLYDKSKVDKNDQRFTLHLSQVSVAEILEKVTEKTGFRFQQVNNAIAVNTDSMPGSIDANLQNVSKTIRGTVTDAETGDPLPGVNIMVPQTSIGTSTNTNGKYEITVPDEATHLRFSFIGFIPQQVEIAGRTAINVALQPDVSKLSEVVVTALGISREQKSLGYSVQEVEGDQLNNVIQENAITSLAGKVSGVSISNTGGSAASSVSMVIRGASSLSGDNQPLFVIDGVPVQNSLSGNISEIGERNVVDYGNAISDLSAADIKSVSVLKGASAAALYGSRAGNGVVLITTKSGKKNQDIKVSLSTSTIFEQPSKFLEMHHMFASGVNPFTEEQWQQLYGDPLTIDEENSVLMGPQLDIGQKAIQWNSPTDANGNPIPTELVSHPDNVKNFVQTGITNTNNIALSGGDSNSTYRFSYTNMNNQGIIPGADLYRNILNLSSSYEFSPSLTLSADVNVGRTHSNNVPANNRGTNPLQWAYYLPSHIDIQSMENYWAEGQKNIQQRTIPDHNNPYFLAYEVSNAFFRDRVYGNTKLSWDVSRDLIASFTFALDRYHEERESKIPYSYSRMPKGAYGIEKINRSESNTSILISYNKSLSDFSLSSFVGGNLLYRHNSSNSISSKQGGLVVPGLYNVSNILPHNLNYGNYISRKAIYSVYGQASLGYKDMVYVDLSARNDWSSTLPEDNRSYFYPSATVSTLLDNIFDMGRQVNMIKLRAAWAQVGNDTAPYRLEQTLNNAGAWGDVNRLSTSGTLLTPDLKPEIITSIEFGTDWRLFQDRLRLSATYYRSENENQILPLSLPQSSGYSSKLINAGLVSSRGIELSLGSTLISTADTQLDLDINFSRNRTRIEELAEGIEYYEFWDDAKGGAYSWVGDDIGSIYDRELVTVEDPDSPYYGWPLLDESGSWQSRSGVNDLVKIGNYNPDFMIGFQTSVKYKNFTFSANVDWRHGGEFVSQTYRYLESDWATQRMLDEVINPNNIDGNIAEYLKEHADELIVGQTPTVGGPTPEMGGYKMNYEGIPLRNGSFNPGVIAQYDDNGNFIGYKENLGGEGTKYIPLSDNYPWSFTKTSLFDASYLKLREISLTYQFPSEWLRPLKLDDLSLSIYSRNIILWTKAGIGIDPERAFQPEGNGTFQQGIERFNVTPFTRSIGFRLSTNF